MKPPIDSPVTRAAATNIIALFEALIFAALGLSIREACVAFALLATFWIVLGIALRYRELR